MYQSWFRHTLLSFTLALMVSTAIVLALLLPRITSHAAPPFMHQIPASPQGGMVDVPLYEQAPGVQSHRDPHQCLQCGLTHPPVAI